VMCRPKAGEEHCAARFSVFHWLLWLHVVVPGERVLHVVHAGSISPAAAEIIALALTNHSPPQHSQVPSHGL
jgi:hypothetical protein